LEKIEMKKTLVAVAALAAIAGAQADVSITGLVEAAYSTNNAGKSIGNSGQNGGSEVRFGGSEELGGGLKASFQYTIISDLTTEGTTAATGMVHSYNSFVGVSGDFGSIKLGNQFSPIFLASAGSTAWGLAANTSSLTNTAYGVGVVGGVRNNQSFNYSSPSISGVTLAAQGDANSSNFSYSLTYSGGPLTVAYGFNRSTTSNGDMNLVGLTYDAGMAKIYLNSLTGKLANSALTAYTANRSATEVGLTVPMGAATIAASTSTSNVTGTKTATNVGVKYDLSKRTQVYYLNTVNGYASTGLAAGSVTNIVGIQHAF